MKGFSYKHPYLVGILAFILVSVGGSVPGLFIGTLTVVSDAARPISPSDPHDGAAMASGMVAGLTTTASFLLGILVGLKTTYYLKSKQSITGKGN